jgi:hypothetical protein
LTSRRYPRYFVLRRLQGALLKAKPNGEQLVNPADSKIGSEIAHEYQLVMSPHDTLTTGNISDSNAQLSKAPTHRKKIANDLIFEKLKFRNDFERNLSFI